MYSINVGMERLSNKAVVRLFKDMVSNLFGFEIGHYKYNFQNKNEFVKLSASECIYPNEEQAINEANKIYQNRD